MLSAFAFGDALLSMLYNQDEPVRHICKRNVEKAILLTDWNAREFEAWILCSDASNESASLKIARKIIKRAQEDKLERITESQMVHDYRKSEPAEVKQALALLVKKGWLVEDNTKLKRKGRPAEHLKLNPKAKHLTPKATPSPARFVPINTQTKTLLIQRFQPCPKYLLVFVGTASSNKSATKKTVVSMLLASLRVFIGFLVQFLVDFLKSQSSPPKYDNHKVMEIWVHNQVW